MPSARADELRRVAAKLGFLKARQTGSHERCKHPDGRATTIPIHSGQGKSAHHFSPDFEATWDRPEEFRQTPIGPASRVQRLFRLGASV